MRFCSGITSARLAERKVDAEARAVRAELKAAEAKLQRLENAMTEAVTVRLLACVAMSCFMQL